MKFYFCEACGVRVTDADLGEGLARDKKLKGIYCAQCAEGVTTVESLPVTELEAKQLLDDEEKAPQDAATPASTPQGPRRTSGIRIQPGRKGAKSSSRMPRSVPASQFFRARFLVPVIVTAAVVVVGLVLFSGSGQKPSRKARDRNAHAKRKHVSRLTNTNKKDKPNRTGEVAPLTGGSRAHAPTEIPASHETKSIAQPASSEDGPCASSSGGTQTEAKVGPPASKETEPARAPEPPAPSGSANAAKTKLDAYLGRFDEAFFRGDLAAACEVAKRAKSDASLEGMTKEVGLPAEALAKVGALVGVADALVAAAAAKKQAREALLDGRKRSFQVSNGPAVYGVVDKIEGETLLVTVEGRINKQVVEYEKRVKLADLTPSFRARLLNEKAPETPDGWMALAVQTLAAGNLGATDKALAQVDTHPLRSHYRRRLDVARLGPLEVEAREFYSARLKPLLGIEVFDKEAAGAALKEIRGFRERYGGARLAKTVAGDIDALEKRTLWALAEELTFKWNCADDADVYLNGKPLREYNPDFRKRKDEAGQTFSARARLIKGDVITVGARRGGSRGFLLVVVDEKGQVVWKTDEENWRLYVPVDQERWFLPEVALKSEATPVTVVSHVWHHSRILNEEHGRKAKSIWRKGHRIAFLYSVFGGIEAGRKRTAGQSGEQATGGSAPAETASESPAVDPERAKLGTYLKTFDEAFFRGDQAGACEVAERAKEDASLKNLAAEVAALAGVADALAAAVAPRKQALEALLGRKRTFQTRKGSVTGVVSKVEGETLRVKVEGQINNRVIAYEKRVKLSELTPACRARLLGEKEPETAAEWVLAALRRLAGKDAGGAGKALSAAGAHPLAGHYRQRLAALQLEAREAAARREWEERVLPLTKTAKFTKTEARKGKEVLSAFRSKHGKTAFAASVARQMQALEKSLEVAGLSKQVTLDLGGGVKMAFVLIPAGTFMMGDPPEEKGPFHERGKPRHKVTLTKAFYLGNAEVTQAQYKRVMGSNPSRWKSPNLPVEQVTWTDCVAFCEKLSALTGSKTRLPTEAEWEYACRAGTTTRFSFGESEAELGEYGWSKNNSFLKTHPVGRKKPNGFGLYDMHGNVWEWCADRFGGYAADAVTDPKGPATGDLRVFRGGSYDFAPGFGRSAFRGIDSNRRSDHGMRVALDF